MEGDDGGFGTKLQVRGEHGAAALCGSSHHRQSSRSVAPLDWLSISILPRILPSIFYLITCTDLGSVPPPKKKKKTPKVVHIHTIKKIEF